MDTQPPVPQPQPAPQPVPQPTVPPAPQPVAPVQPVQPMAPQAQPVTPIPETAPQPAPQPQVVAPATPVAQPAPQPTVAPAPQAVEAPVAATFSEVTSPVDQAPLEDASLTWSAVEYIDIDKSPVWYILVIVIALLLVAVDVFLLKSWTFSVLVVVMAIATIIYARRPARTITYALSAAQGIYVGEQLHPFDEFKSFSLIKADGHNSIVFIPKKRFSLGVTIYFPDEAGEEIVDIIGGRLSMEERKPDIFDSLIRKLRL